MYNKNDSIQSLDYVPDEDYDPYSERYIKKPLQNWEAYNLLLRGCMHTGLLSLPKAFRHSGILVGILDLIAVSIFITYMYHTLMNTRLTLCKILRVGRLYYPECMKRGFKIGPACIRVFSPVIGVVVDFIIVVHQLTFLCAYLSYMARDLKRTFEVFYFYNFPNYAYALILGPYLLIIMCVNNIKIYAVFAVVANIVSLVSIAFLVYYLLEDLPNFTLLPALSSPLNHILFIIPAFFALQSLPLVSTIELNVQNGKNFLAAPGILCQVHATLTIISLIVAVLGYWRFEEQTLGFITLNLDVKRWVAQVVVILYFVGIYISYGLQGLIGVNVIWEHYFSKIICIKSDFLTGIIEYIFRFLIFVGIPLLVVVYLHINLALIFCFHGICISFLIIIFPALLEICVLWPTQKFGTCNYIFVKNILLVCFGICILILSGYHGYRHFNKLIQHEDDSCW